MYKKGISDVVSNTLLILIVVVGVVLIGAFVITITNTTGDSAQIKSCQLLNDENKAGYEDCIIKAFGEVRGRQILGTQEGDDFEFTPDQDNIPGILNPDDIDENLCYLELEFNEKIKNFEINDIVNYRPKPGYEVLKVSPSLSSANASLGSWYAWLRVVEGPVYSNNYVWYKLKHSDYNFYVWTLEDNLLLVEQTTSSLDNRFIAGDEVVVSKPTLKYSDADYNSYPTRGWWKEGSGTNIESGLKGKVVYSQREGMVLHWTSVNIPSVMIYYNISFEDGTSGFIYEKDIEPVRIKVNLTKSEKLYGDYLYNTEPTSIFGDDPYSLKTYDSSGNELGSYLMFPFSNVAVVYVDNYPTVDKIKVFSKDLNYFIFESRFSEDVSCKRTCGKYNELIDISLGQSCCSGVFAQSTSNENIMHCTRCGDLTCEVDEKYTCALDCKPRSYPETNYFLNLWSNVILSDRANVTCKLYNDPHTSASVLANIDSESSGIIINGPEFNQERWWWQINMSESVNTVNKIGWAMDDCLMKQ